jgi:hypothetical protein
VLHDSAWHAGVLQRLEGRAPIGDGGEGASIIGFSGRGDIVADDLSGLGGIRGTGVVRTEPGREINFSRTVPPGVFIFCVTALNAREHARRTFASQLDRDYTSAYEIQEPGRFAQAACRVLAATLPPDAGVTRIQVLHRLVKYVPTRVVKVPVDSAAGITWPDESAEDVIFRKEDDDAWQREYRFVFVVDGWKDAPKEGVLVNLPDRTACCSAPLT